MQKRLKRGNSKFTMLIVGAALAAAPAISSATTLYWDTNGSNPANGTWGGPTDTTDTNWNTAADGSGTQEAYVAGSDVVFSAPSSVTSAGVTVNTAVTANSLTFAEGATTLSGLPTTSNGDSITIGAGGISIASGATATAGDAAGNAIGSINILVGANQIWTNNGSGTFEAPNLSISNSSALTLSGSGTFQFGNTGTNNSVAGTGSINVDGATLIDSSSSGGSAGVNNNSLIFTAGTFKDHGSKGIGGFTLGGDFTIGADSSITFGGNVSLTTASTNYTLTVNNTTTNFEDILEGSEPGQTLSFTAATGTTTGVGFNDDGKYHPAVVLSGAGTAAFGLNGGSMQGALTLESGTGLINSVNTITSGTLTKGATGTGTFHLAGGTLASNGASDETIATNVSLDGSVTLGSTSHAFPIFIDGTALSTPSTVLLTASPTLTVVEPTTVADAITDGGNGLGFTKAGAAALTLTGINTYSGTTAVNVGTLAVNSTSAPAALANTSGITIATTGALSLVSTSSSPNLINDGATITVVGTGSIIDLELADNVENIASFVVGTTAQPVGVYGSATYYSDNSLTPNAAELADEGYFTGNGTLGIVPEPASAGLILAGMTLAFCRRRRSAR